MTSARWTDLQELSRHECITRIIDQEDEIKRLCAKVTELQEIGSRHVMERQRMTAYGGRARRQKLFLSLIRRVIGESAIDLKERAMRLLEEATEAAQAAGVQWKQATDLVTFVYSKPTGDLRGELGGVATTLMAFCEAAGFQVEDVERDELERALSLPEDHVRKKHQAKVEHGVGLDGEG